MQLTYILGNGFDLAIKLKTGYKHFYEWYEEKPDETEEISLLKKTIREQIDKGNDKWADFEYALGQFTALVADKEKYIACFKCARESLIEYLKKAYSEGKEKNKDFLLSATYKIVDRSQNSDEDLSEEDKTNFETPKNVDTVFNCISFNYTPVFDEGKKDLLSNARGFSNSYNRPSRYEIGEVLNVHGTLNDYPILGVDNKTQIANKDFREDMEIVEMMVKGEVDKKLGRNWRNSALEIIRKSDKIYIYGTSLGETDEFWWKIIAEWFESDTDNHQLAIYCHPEDDEMKMERKKELFKSNISKYFRNKNYDSNIVIDNVEKVMTIKFAHASAKKEIRMSVHAELNVIPAKDLK